MYTLFSSIIELIEGHHGIIYDIIFNVLIFIPGGFLIKCKINKQNTVFTIFLISFVIETVQILSARGLFEISDIFANTIGGYCGIVLNDILKHLNIKI